MLFRQFIREYAARTGRTIRDSTEACEDFISLVMDVLLSGDNLNIMGFGRLSTVYEPNCKRFNPKTNQMEIINRVRMYFRGNKYFMKKLKEAYGARETAQESINDKDKIGGDSP